MRIPAVAFLAVCMVAGGCTSAVDGRPVAESSAPALTRPLDQVLPTTDELSAALNIGPNGYLGQLVEGGADRLRQGVASAEATPAECVSATYRLQKAVYDASSVRSVATRSWAGGGLDRPAFTGYFGVVKLADAGDARAFFA